MLNEAVFSGKLKPPTQVQLVNHRNEFAWTVPNADDTVRITINSSFSSRRLFLSVLVHEMVHAWEHALGYPLSHGKRFIQWRKRIKRLTTLELEVEIYDTRNAIR